MVESLDIEDRPKRWEARLAVTQQAMKYASVDLLRVAHEDLIRKFTEAAEANGWPEGALDKIVWTIGWEYVE